MIEYNKETFPSSDEIAWETKAVEMVETMATNAGPDVVDRLKIVGSKEGADRGVSEEMWRESCRRDLEDLQSSGNNLFFLLL